MYWHSKQNYMLIKNSCSGKFVLKIKVVGIRCRLNLSFPLILYLKMYVVADPRKFYPDPDPVGKFRIRIQHKRKNFKLKNVETKIV